MPKFRKKPVVIEAVQFTGGNLDELIDFTSVPDKIGGVPARYLDAFGPDRVTITTLEGEMMGNVGDWIIKGVNGEFYPCKPDIFEKTYEEVDEKAVEFTKK